MVHGLLPAIDEKDEERTLPKKAPLSPPPPSLIPLSIASMQSLLFYVRHPHAYKTTLTPILLFLGFHLNNFILFVHMRQ